MTADGSASVRRADDGDLLGMLRLIERDASLHDYSITQVQRRTWQLMLENDDVTPYIAEVGDTPVGYTVGYTVRHLTYDCRPGMLIESMFVLPERRRQGIARKMIEKVVEGARTQGVHKVQLLTHKRHAEDGAHALYQAVGFVAEAEGFRMYLS